MVISSWVGFIVGQQYALGLVFARSFTVTKINSLNNPPISQITAETTNKNLRQEQKNEIKQLQEQLNNLLKLKQILDELKQKENVN